MRRIDQDVTRFKRIVKGQIRKNLKQYVSSGDLIARQGDRTVRVPLPQITMGFRHGLPMRVRPADTANEAATSFASASAE